MKKKMKCSVLLLFICSMLFCIAFPTTAKGAVKKEYLTHTKLTMLPGSERTVTLKSASKKVQFKVSNPKIASIKVKGKSAVIRAKKAGKATLTASVSGKKYTCVIKVMTEKQFKDQNGNGFFFGDNSGVFVGNLKGIDGILLYKKLPSGKLKRIKKLPSRYEENQALGGKIPSVTAKNYKQIYFRGYAKINHKTIFTRLNEVVNGDVPAHAYGD